MKSILHVLFPEKQNFKVYRDHLDYIIDLMKQVEMLMVYYLECLPVYNTKVDSFRIDALLNRGRPSSPSSLFDIGSQTAKFDYLQADFIIAFKLKNRTEEADFLAFNYVRELFKLTPIEKFCLVLSLMPDIDPKYRNLFAYIQDDFKKIRPTYELVLKLFYFVSDISEIDDFYNKKMQLKDKMSTLCFEEGEDLIPDKGLYAFIISNGDNIGKIKGIELYMPKDPKELPAMDYIAKKLYYTASKIEARTAKYFYVHGVDSIGKRTQVKRFAYLMDMCVVMVDLKKVNKTSEAEFMKAVDTACRVATVYQGAVCIYNLHILQNGNEENNRALDYLIQKSGDYSDIVFLLSNTKLEEKSFSENKIWIDVPIEYPEKEESITLWETYLKDLDVKIEDKLEPYELANKFTFTPGQIAGTIQEAYKESIWNQRGSLNKKEVYKCAYTQIVHNLSKQADLIYAKYSWDQLILPDDQKEMLMNACNQIKYKHIVYNKWGMEKRLSYGRGVSMLFSGPPGTGKTMGAQVVANELDIEIYKVDLSQIVSKYIGETEKNLNELFQEAKKSNVILFFDETDAILGKRTEVKDAHDKNANLETSYLLQKMEEYDGITVMTTNYLENIDSAFFRRISYVIHFPFPDVISRDKIWRNMFPKEMPLDEDIDFDYLSNQFEISGGSIKNVAVSAAFLAAKDYVPVNMTHILKALKYELTKQGKTVLREDFGENYYLL